MKNALFTDTVREIRKSFGRFISIFGIVLVGVAFLTGVRASAPYMKKSADTYFDRSHLLDLKIYSTVGFSDEDVRAVRETEGVSGAAGAYSVNALATINTSELVFQVMSFDVDAAADDSSDYINRLTLKEGRLPENSGECVIRDYEMSKANLQIGDTISLYSGTDEALTDSTLVTSEYTIVGKVSTSYYLSYQYDSASVGSGKVETVIFVPLNDFKGSLLFGDGGYNVMYATVDGADEVNTYSDEYFDIINPVRERIEKLGEERCTELVSTYESYGGRSPLSGIDVKWYVYDRDSHFSYVDYGNCGDRMEAIAKVFPVFFYLVAALVCLTTMTRMVDEQRQVIGTLKALGYNKLRIAMKYIAYASVASLGGGIAGCIVGLNSFPRIIFMAWNTVYTVEEFAAEPQFILCIIAVAIAVAVTVAAVIAACIGVLMETPALLLRPKSPKNGRKIFLEHIGFIWKRMSFSGKVTARNILRYKKRFFMTVIGIAGCTALILAGFGIKNSVSMVVGGQYGEIFSYDLSGKFGSDTDKEAFMAEYSDNDNIRSVYIDTEYSGVAGNDGISGGSAQKSVTIVSVDDAQKYSQYVTLTRHQDGEETEIPEDGALITYKMAKDLDLKADDEFYVSTGGDEYHKVRVADIVEMYVGQYVFMQDGYYEQCFGEEAGHNSFIAIVNNEDTEEEQKLGAEMMDKYDIQSISYFSGIQSSFSDMIGSIDIITVVLIISAALLAFVVLYNLINVNISERVREIATIKVLGFYDSEVAAYVYRENVILSVIGSLAGLLLGIFLHGYIMKIIEMDDIVFPRIIFWYSYLISMAITIVFGLLVNLAMYKKLRKIPMVESLKSVE